MGAEEQSAIKMNVTIHKQITTLLEESGTTGMTLNVRSLLGSLFIDH
jgi:hypothetical protein